jgi:CSLREA domain-containing protein
MGAAAFLAPGAQAADMTFQVNTTNDTAPGACDLADCTLREAINAANANDGNDTITFGPGASAGTIRLTAALGVNPTSTDDTLTIDGPGVDDLTVSGDTNNSATPDAGDVRILNISSGGDVTITGLTLTRGFVPSAPSQGGGAILANGQGTLALVDAAVTKSRSEATDPSASGGGIQQGSPLSLTRTTLSGNTATVSDGGAVGGTTDNSLTISNSTFTNNSGESGGALGVQAVTRIDGSTFTGNHATSATAGSGGGGLNVENSLRISGSTISGNTVVAGGGVGGGIDSRPKYGLDIVDSTISGNTAPQGAGLALGSKYSGAESNLVRSTIVNNHATTGGGGIAVMALSAADSMTVNRSTISGNTGGGGPSFGGGILFPGNPSYATVNGDFEVLNSTISGNSATNGGGVSVGTSAEGQVVGSKGSITFDNSTVAANTATSKGGGFYLGQYDSGSPAVKKSATVVGNSTIVADNTAAAAAQDLDRVNSSTGGGFSLSLSLVEKPGDAPIFQTPANSVILGVDPQLGPLANNGGTTRTKLPSATSPAIDKGLSSPRLAVDQRGATRDVDALGLPNPRRGDGTDIGAVEVQNPFVPVAPTPDKRPKAVITKNRLDAKKKRRRVVSGTASDDHAVAKVQVALVMKVKGRCRELQKSGQFGRKRKCTIPPHRFLKATGKAKWRFKLKHRLDAGKYVVYARAIDDKGQKQRSFTKENRRKFEVK